MSYNDLSGKVSSLGVASSSMISCNTDHYNYSVNITLPAGAVDILAIPRLMWNDSNALASSCSVNGTSKAGNVLTVTGWISNVAGLYASNYVILVLYYIK